METFRQAVHSFVRFDPTLSTGSWSGFFVLSVTIFMTLIAHKIRLFRLWPLYLIGVTLLPAAFLALFYIPLEIRGEKFHLVDLLFNVVTYSFCIYIFLCEWLLRGGAKQLTAWRGEHWPKEIDYIYLSIGALGLALALGKSSATIERFSGSDLAGAVLVATAFVFRCVKTRAEIAGWNKSGPIDMVGDEVVRKRAGAKAKTDLID